MSTTKTILTTILTLALLVLLFTTASADAVTRELTGTIGSSLEGTLGLAVDLETGNVYVADSDTEAVDIFSATGGAPSGGVPSQITGLEDLGLEGRPDGIAVDNSCYEHNPRLTKTTTPTCAEYDPSYGDVYITLTTRVIKVKLNSAGKYEQVEEFVALDSKGEENESTAVAVDSQGGLYILGPAVRGSIKEKSSDPSGQFPSVTEKSVSGMETTISQAITFEPGFLAVDDSDDIYLGPQSENGLDSGVGKLKIGALGEILSEEVLAPPIAPDSQHRPVAVDRSTGSVFVGDGNHVDEYGEAGGEPQSEFGSAEPSGGLLIHAGAVSAVAVNSSTGQVYVANTSEHDVDVFGSVLSPATIPVEQPAASDLTRTSALLAGTADPEGGDGSYWYEYVPDGEYEPGAADPYVQGGRTVTTALPTAHTDESIERVVLSGLLPGTTYRYRLVVSNPSGPVYGPDQTFATAPATPPIVTTGAAGEIGATSATLTGSVGPQGLATSYVFEVGTSRSYEGARLFGNSGSSTGEVQATVALQYLVPGTTYHYRLAATNFDGTTYGQDQSFTTPNVPSPIGQPTAIPLIATPTVEFPSIAGATMGPAKVTTKALTNAQKLKNALKGCRKKPKRQRAVCEKQASKKYGKAK